MCVCVSFVMRGCVCVCVGVLVICVLVFTVFCIVCTVYFILICFVCIYCKDYCHRVTTQLQLSGGSSSSSSKSSLVPSIQTISRKYSSRKLTAEQFIGVSLYHSFFVLRA